jgi:hypothetical protein
MIKIVRVKKQIVSTQFSPLPSYHFGHDLRGCTVGTSTGIPTEIVAAVVPQTSSPNPVKMPTVVYGCLLHLPLRFYFSPTQTEGTGAIVGVKHPGARRYRLWLINTAMIGSLQWQTAGELHAPYHIMPTPYSRPREGGPLTLVTSPGRPERDSGIQPPPWVPPLPRKAWPASRPRKWGIHYLTNDEASMPDSIYPGAETCLITDCDNDLMKGTYIIPDPHPCWAVAPRQKATCFE